MARTIKYHGYTIKLESVGKWTNFDVSRERPVAAGFAITDDEGLQSAQRLIDGDFETPILAEIRKISKTEGQSFGR